MDNYKLTPTEYESVKLSSQIGCCPRCCLRLCGMYFSETTIESEILLSEVEAMSNEVKIERNSCTICLGILRNEKMMEIVNDVIKQIDVSEYDSNSILFALNSPCTIQVRERAVQIFLTKKVSHIQDFQTRVQCIKDVWKLFLISRLKDHTLKPTEETNDTLPSLTIDIFMSYPNDQEECRELLSGYKNLANPRHFPTYERKNLITKRTIETIMTTISDEQFEECMTIPPQLPEHSISFDKMACTRSSILIAGRYTKLSRKLCQTPWLIGGKSKMETSVQDLICQHINDLLQAESVKFLSSGREDVDVRMLLQGRPFAVDFVNPKISKFSQKDLQSLNEKINESSKGLLITNNLKLISRSELKKLKEGELTKTKTYRSLCICKNVTEKASLIEKLEAIQKLEVIQYTPIRVLHRRSYSPRKRVIHQVRARFPFPEELEKFQKNLKYSTDEDIFIVLDLKTQAGTYVKEFIHGDFGRTQPNLCDLLGIQIDIIALDVTNISLDWP